MIAPGSLSVVTESATCLCNITLCSCGPSYTFTLNYTTETINGLSQVETAFCFCVTSTLTPICYTCITEAVQGWISLRQVYKSFVSNGACTMSRHIRKLHIFLWGWTTPSSGTYPTWRAFLALSDNSAWRCLGEGGTTSGWERSAIDWMKVIIGHMSDAARADNVINCTERNQDEKRTKLNKKPSSRYDSRPYCITAD